MVKIQCVLHYFNLQAWNLSKEGPIGVLNLSSEPQNYEWLPPFQTLRVKSIHSTTTLTFVLPHYHSCTTTIHIGRIILNACVRQMHAFKCRVFFIKICQSGVYPFYEWKPRTTPANDRKAANVSVLHAYGLRQECVSTYLSSHACRTSASSTSAFLYSL